MNDIKNTFRTISLLIFLILGISNVTELGAQRFVFNDGPYVTYLQDSTEILWINKGNFHKVLIPSDEDYTFNEEGFTSFKLSELTIEKDEETSFENVDQMIILSDIHGQYDVFHHLMRQHGVINGQDEWSYGKGHLVIVGDMLDRGPDVIPVLWLLYHLEKQAKKAGGKVHVLLGNHEVMVMNGEVGYLHKNYRYTSGISRRLYQKFFDDNTFFGKWFLTKKVAVSINNMAFVHGGFSEQVLGLNKSFDEITSIFHSEVFYSNNTKLSQDSVLSLLSFENGPLWYRGYAQPYAFDTDQAENILKVLDKDRIIVGHTSMPRVMGLYSNRIILVDSSIKFGKSGEVLLYKDGMFSRGQMDGTEIPLIPENEKPERESILNELLSQNRPTLYFQFDQLPVPFELGALTNQKAITKVFFDTYGLDFSGSLIFEENKIKRKCLSGSLRVLIDEEELYNFGYNKDNEISVEIPCKLDVDIDEWESERKSKIQELEPNASFKSMRIIISDQNGIIADLKGLLTYNT